MMDFFFVKKVLGAWPIHKKNNSRNSDVPNILNIRSDKNTVCFLFGVIYMF